MSASGGAFLLLQLNMMHAMYAMLEHVGTCWNIMEHHGTSWNIMEPWDLCERPQGAVQNTTPPAEVLGSSPGYLHGGLKTVASLHHYLKRKAK